MDEIKRMQLEGRQDQEISDALQSRGFSSQSINEALGQNKIKDAVSGSPDQTQTEELPTQHSLQSSSMQPSLMSPPTQPTAETPQPAYPPQAYAQQTYAQAYSQDYAPEQQYDTNQGYAYAPATSADTIAEIAEQVVVEKLQPLRQNIEKTLDLRNSIETKMQYLDERLKKIEKIIDRLQLSILQKVGEYMSNVDDLKQEIQETQKSFKSLLTARTPATSE